ncbi:MAG: metallophosphoesterase [Flavobacteriales bacterium]|nr:metallophosphoesterase [Flavobacteriales bacterium]
MSDHLFVALIFLLVVLTIDIYVGVSLRKILQPLRTWLRRLVWSLDILSWMVTAIILYTMIFNPRDGMYDRDLFENITVGLFMAFLVSKLLLIAFLLIQDVLGWPGKLRRAVRAQQARPVNESRRRFIGQTGLVLASLPFTSLLWGMAKGRYNYAVKRQVLYFSDLPEAFEGFTITQISDIHSGSFDNMEAVQRGVDLIAAQNSDMILFTGDLVNGMSYEIEPYLEMFGKLSAPFGKYSTMGNHDYGIYEEWENEQQQIDNTDKIMDHHATMGFRLLNNESLKIEKDGQHFRLAGVENWGKPPFPSKGDLDATFPDTEREFTVLMSHDPHHWDEKVLHHEKHVDLTLSGHTHGMQFGVEIPWLKWSPVQYVYPRWAGLYAEGRKMLYVNRGFGFIGYPGRVGVMPEITVLELRKEMA